MKSPSTLVYEFALALVAESPVGSGGEPSSSLAPDGNIEVLDSDSQPIKKDRGIVVSNAEWGFAPKGEVTNFYDALIIVGFFVRVPGIDTSERREKRDLCFQMAMEFAQAIYDDQTLGERVCDVNIRRVVDGYNNDTSTPFAILNLPLIINPTGEPVDDSLGEAR